MNHRTIEGIRQLELRLNNSVSRMAHGVAIFHLCDVCDLCADVLHFTAFFYSDATNPCNGLTNNKNLSYACGSLRWGTWKGIEEGLSIYH